MTTRCSGVENVFLVYRMGWGGEGEQLLIHSLNEIQTMFSQLARQSSRILSCQRFNRMRMRRLFNLRQGGFPGQKKDATGSCQKHQRKRHMEKLTSMNL